MRTYAFDLALDADSAFDADGFFASAEGPLFEAFAGDVTPAVLVGQPRLLCTVEAQSLEDALEPVVRWAEAEGLRPVRVEIPADALA